MSSYKQNKFYISDIDQFLEEYNRTHPKSTLQQAEIAKYQRLNKLRDNAQSEKPANPIWEEF